MAPVPADRRAVRIARIFDAAAREFAAKGFHAARMADIAAATGMQKGNLYYYFDSKERLFADLMADRVGAGLDEIRRIATLAEAPPHRVRKAIRAQVVTFHTHRDVYTIWSSERLRTTSREVSAVVDRKTREYTELWRRIITDGVDAGAFRSDLDIPSVVEAVMGMCAWTLTWLRPKGRPSSAAVAEHLADLVLEGLGTEPRVR